jgi:hypothetical protein
MKVHIPVPVGRDRQPAAPMPLPPIDYRKVSLEKHYSVSEVAKMWRISQKAVKTFFWDEPGVLKLVHKHAGKQDYTILRIPESIMARVHERRSR